MTDNLGTTATQKRIASIILKLARAISKTTTRYSVLAAATAALIEIKSQTSTIDAVKIHLSTNSALRDPAWGRHAADFSTLHSTYYNLLWDSRAVQ